MDYVHSGTSAFWRGIVVVCPTAHTHTDASRKGYRLADGESCNMDRRAETDRQGAQLTMRHCRTVTWGRIALAFSVCAATLAALPARAAAPANDSRSNAVDLTLDSPVSADATEATLEAEESHPPCAFSGTMNGVERTVWFRYTSDATRWLVLSTQGSNYDTVLAAYRAAGNSLHNVDCFDDYGDEEQTERGWVAVHEGETLWFQVGTPRYLTPTLLDLRQERLVAKFRVSALGWSYPLAFRPPPNDQKASASHVDALPYHDSQQIDSGGLESEEIVPCGDPDANSVWYRYSPVADEVLSAHVSRDRESIAVAIYAHDQGKLRLLACDDDGGDISLVSARTRVLARPGNTYLIQVLGTNPVTQSMNERTITLSLSAGDPVDVAVESLVVTAVARHDIGDPVARHIEVELTADKSTSVDLIIESCPSADGVALTGCSTITRVERCLCPSKPQDFHYALDWIPPGIGEMIVRARLDAEMIDLYPNDNVIEARTIIGEDITSIYFGCPTWPLRSEQRSLCQL